jgi:hypothetical protein
VHTLNTTACTSSTVSRTPPLRQVELRFRRCLDTSYQRFSQYQALYGKKAAATNGQLFGHTLRQVHGCSAAAAQSLMRKYYTVARFVDSLKLIGPMKAEVRWCILVLATAVVYVPLYVSTSLSLPLSLCLYVSL